MPEFNGMEYFGSAGPEVLVAKKPIQEGKVFSSPRAKQLQKSLMDEECVDPEGNPVTINEFDEPEATDLEIINDLEEKIDAKVSDEDTRKVIKKVFFRYVKAPTITYNVESDYNRKVALNEFVTRLDLLVDDTMVEEEKMKYEETKELCLSNRLKRGNISHLLYMYEVYFEDDSKLGDETKKMVEALKAEVEVQHKTMAEADDIMASKSFYKEEELNKYHYTNLSLPEKKAVTRLTVKFIETLIADLTK